MRPFNPDYWLKPVNRLNLDKRFHPANPLNPVNRFNPDYRLNPGKRLNPVNRFNPFQRFNTVNPVRLDPFLAKRAPKAAARPMHRRRRRRNLP